MTENNGADAIRHRVPRRRLMEAGLALIGGAALVGLYKMVTGSDQPPHPPKEVAGKPEKEIKLEQAFIHFLGVLDREYKIDNNPSLWLHLKSLLGDPRLKNFFKGGGLIVQLLFIII